MFGNIKARSRGGARRSVGAVRAERRFALDGAAAQLAVPRVVIG